MRPTFAPSVGVSFRSLHERVRHQCVQLLTKYECSHCGKTFKMAHLLRKPSDERTPASLQAPTIASGADTATRRSPASASSNTIRGLTTRNPISVKSAASVSCLRNAWQPRSPTQTTTDRRAAWCAARGFRNRYDLKQPMRTHTGERPYQCTHCSQCFSTAGGATEPHQGSQRERSRTFAQIAHMLNHSGVRPYHCQICPKTYTCLNHLRRHLKSHSNMN
ncbi:hypothetical protein KUCAC02_017949 [Chaenocephalus aceratus]|uniref:Uncharacterized protein n=1 Tax=Chaenocephalus aceratus TaxID=36190 RepID=A0ACB9W7U9_CHAAC|nr:hypothetical protein KUCAC02_017949 [Chaenocephalus aceratus]